MGFHCICFSCSHALCFSPLTPSDSRLESPVCREEYSAGEAVRKPPCLHYFHNKCVVVELVRARGGCGRDVRACGICHDLSRVLNWGLWQQHRRVFCFNAPESFGWRPSGQCLWMQHLKKSQHECPPGLLNDSILVVKGHCEFVLYTNSGIQCPTAISLCCCYTDVLPAREYFFLPPTAWYLPNVPKKPHQCRHEPLAHVRRSLHEDGATGEAGDPRNFKISWHTFPIDSF